ncbi:MAG: hypothetical protein AAGN15_03300 [Cyanobacteria bacterium J06581_3]
MSYGRVASALGFVSFIYFRDRLFKYPFTFTNALKHLGPIDVSLTALSYLQTWLTQLDDNYSDMVSDTAESWLKQRFGTHLYNIFFASYCQKLWGQPASQLQADCGVVMVQNILGNHILAADKCSRDRSIITVTLVLAQHQLSQNEPFAESEIHVQSPDVQVSHIQHRHQQSTKNFPTTGRTCLDMTYLCDEDDAFWQLNNEALVQLASQELMDLKLIPDIPSLINSGQVSRHAAAYPGLQRPLLSPPARYSALSRPV